MLHIQYACLFPCAVHAGGWKDGIKHTRHSTGVVSLVLELQPSAINAAATTCSPMDRVEMVESIIEIIKQRLLKELAPELASLLSSFPNCLSPLVPNVSFYGTKLPFIGQNHPRWRILLNCGFPMHSEQHAGDVMALPGQAKSCTQRSERLLLSH